MRKILIIGENSTSTSELYSKLSECFTVTKCKTDINFISSTIMLNTPDLIVMNLINMKAAEMLLFQLKSSYDIPIVILCRLSDSQKYISYVDNSKIRACYSESVDNSVVKLCCKSLGLDYNEVMQFTMNESIAGRSTILLIDDSSIFLRQGKSMLEEDYNVFIATSAEKGLELLMKHKVDLILLDYEMPITDGKQAFIEIREMPETRNTPIIFLTGVSDKEHIAEVVKLKPNGYILKPVTKDDLLARIKPILK